MAEYSDYGFLYDPITKTGIQPSQLTTLPKQRTQVYKATHVGEDRLPYMDRSFISFSYGGKHIEDFNMIASSGGDRMQRNAYAQFEDLTSTYATLTGQFYWGSYYRNNTITFNLVTDGTTQRQLDEFKYWFAAGKTRELILAEHPNRAIMARVSEPPRFSLIGFESPIAITLERTNFSTSTTLYKGEIELTMTMDDPYWYAKINIFGHRGADNIYRDTWIDANGKEHNVLEIPDALKILYEDGIPIASMIQHTMLFGSNIFASVDFKLYSKIVATITEDTYLSHASTEGYFNNGLSYDIVRETEPGVMNPWPYYCGATIAKMTNDGQYISGAKIAGATMNDTVGISHLDPFDAARPDSTSVSFYYAGTAPSPTILKFNLTPVIDNQGFITCPANSYSTNLPSGHQYNTITIEGNEEKKEFKFTTPNIYTSFNQIIRIFDNPDIIKKKESWATVRELIRETVWHPEIRAWANRVIDVYDDEDGQGIIDPTMNIDTTSSIRLRLKLFMSYIFKAYGADERSPLLPVSFSFDAKTGEAFGEFVHRTCIGKDPYDKSYDSLNNPGSRWAQYCNDSFKTVKENVGDMVKSKYLIIEERNYPDENNQIVKWRAMGNEAHRLYHDVVPNGLSNIYIDYQNLYL